MWAWSICFYRGGAKRRGRAEVVDADVEVDAGRLDRWQPDPGAEGVPRGGHASNLYARAGQGRFVAAGALEGV